MDITWAIFDNIIVIFWIIIPCNEAVNADYHIRDFTYIHGYNYLLLPN